MLNRCALLFAVYLLDQAAGDPEGFPHPVRLIGSAISKGETLLRRRGHSRAMEFTSGALLTTTIVTATYALTRLAIQQAWRRSQILGCVTEITLGWTCLAARNLEQEATSVTKALEADDTDLARRRLARIVGRDTQQLDIHEISRAVIETVAESGSDGIIAPLFYMTCGGVPLAMAYKAVNTLDSMIGHADARYFFFGKAAARLDDAANYLPARLTALSIVAASCLESPANAQCSLSTWFRDGNKHKSPNAGQPESAMAGALHVQLGGNNSYDGELIPADCIGLEFPAPEPTHARKAIHLISVVTLLGVGAGMLLSAIAQTRARK